MSGMFTKLIDAGEYHSHNPFREIKRLREAVTEMAFLSSEEITRLLSMLDGDELMQLWSAFLLVDAGVKCLI
ncbi:integrase [Escherichia coli]|uniref:Integrase n=1 Tax=Escherichia coli TaxID=562 RepID=A0A2X1P4R5_ECOLX|nr:integrase [Escherichia coli]